MFLMTFLGFAGVGALMMAISIPMIRGKVKPNPFYGFRTPKTMSSDRIWYAANAYSGRTLFVAGAAIIGSSVLFAPLALIPRPWVPELYAAIYVISLIVFLGWSLIADFRYLRKL